jgi:hypothetical protein
MYGVFDLENYSLRTLGYRKFRGRSIGKEGDHSERMVRPW